MSARQGVRAAVRLAGAAALVLAAAPAIAQPVNGLYVGGALGGVFVPPGRVTAPTPDAPAPVPADPHGETGLSGHGSFGYGLGNGLRFEVEGDGNRLRLPRGP